MNVALILNGTAGAAKAEDPNRTPERLRELFESHGCSIDVLVTPGEGIAEAASRTKASGVDAVVAGGGDGTVSAVASVLAGGAVPLGVLPLGTLNNFARDAGIPLDIEEAVRTVVTGTPKAIDLGEVNGRLFVNNSSVGLYPALVSARDAWQEKTGHGKWRAMAAVSFRVLRRFPVLNVRIQTNGESSQRITPVVFVGNNEYQMSLFNQGRRDCLDEGKLCLYVANCHGVGCILRLIFRFMAGRLEQAKDFESTAATEVWIQHRKRSLRVSIDGEVMRLEMPLRYRTRPAALKVILPLKDAPEQVAPG